MAWQYGLFDLAGGDDEEQWARNLADQGWRLWHRSGTRVTINGRTVTRYSLRRQIKDRAIRANAQAR